MHKKLGPLEAWQWAAILAGLLLVYYEYEKNKASSASTGVPASSTDTSGAIDPTTGLPYASEIGSGAGVSGAGGGVGDTTGAGNLQQELSDLGAIEGLMSGLGLGQTVTASGLSTDQTATLNADLNQLNTTLGRQTTAFGKLQKRLGAGTKKTTKAVKKATTPKKTVKHGGTHNPGHHVTTHPHGAKSAHSSAPHNARQHTNVAPPSHQRATQHAPTPRPKPKKKARH